MTMEIETAVEPTVFVHPLALVHMADQYTRIRLGGSPLQTSAPVVGVLFGTQKESDVAVPSSSTTTTNNTSTSMSSHYFVEDAGDFLLEEAGVQIELHRAVFPKHQVMGWYKVVDNNSNNEPSAQDLKQTQQIQSLYQQSKPPAAEGDTDMTSAEETPASTITFFGLLQVPSTKKEKADDSDTAGEKMKTSSSKSSGAGDEKTETDDNQDEDLPLTLYRLEQGSALVAISTWSLRTADSERVAVQRVMREKESGHSSGSEQQHHNLQMVEPKVILPYTEEVQESCLAISARLAFILQYLQSLPRGEYLPPEHLPLLRQVQGLMLQLGPIAATVPSSQENQVSEATLQQLASLAMAVDSVALFAEKFRFLHEHSMSSGGRGGSSGRDMRRY